VELGRRGDINITFCREPFFEFLFAKLRRLDILQTCLGFGEVIKNCLDRPAILSCQTRDLGEPVLDLFKTGR
jgi:hypothetical protein